MKTIVFRPLRIIKKTGKITVASYMQWRKVKTADYNRFKLIVDSKYKSLPKNELVFNHEGEQLFWFNYHPDEIRVYDYRDWSNLGESLNEIRKGGNGYAISWANTPLNYCAKGLDCSGVPVFSHNTAEYIAVHYKDMEQFEPLTVEKVVNVFGWFLYQLENNELVFV